MLPNTAPSSLTSLRNYLYLAALSFTFLQAGLYASRRANIPAVPWTLPGTNAKQLDVVHPITQLMADAEAAYRQKVARQSKTLRDAVAEYRKRYGRAPPKGFDRWWTFAQANGVRLVDEFDGVVADLAPFWELSGAELRTRAQEVCTISFCPMRSGPPITRRLSASPTPLLVSISRSTNILRRWVNALV